jgi:hypothetical protein
MHNQKNEEENEALFQEENKQTRIQQHGALR